MCVTFKRLHTRLGLIVPNLDQFIVRARDEVWTIASSEILHAIDAFLVPLKREVWGRLTDRPHLDGSVQRRRGKSVRVLRVESSLHDIVRMSLEHLCARPTLVPIPQLDEHVIRARQDIGHSRVHRNTSNVVSVRFERLDKLAGIVVVDPDKHIIRSTNDPLLSNHPFCGAHW